GHQGRQHRVYFAPGEIAEVTDGRVRRAAERKRGVVLAPIAIDQDTRQIVLADTHVPDPIQAALPGGGVGAVARDEVDQDVPGRTRLAESERVVEALPPRCIPPAARVPGAQARRAG